jgi:dynamin 1-like protein
VDLTLIDLPGITRIPIGNQPKDIERITKEMVTRYCKDE